MSKSDNIAIIGKGLIGKRLAQFVTPTHIFDSKTLSDLPMQAYDIVYLAAPSSNRIWVNQNPDRDTESIELIISTLLKTKIERIVLISTVDTQANPDTVYSANRLKLEELVTTRWNYHHVVRLPGLIGSEITKNILYDIKHQTQWVDSINTGARQQWYILDDLEHDIKNITAAAISTVTNLVSEPILNKEIVDTFYKQTDRVETGISYNLKPYKYTKDRIFDAIKVYMGDSFKQI